VKIRAGATDGPVTMLPLELPPHPARTTTASSVERMRAGWARVTAAPPGGPRWTRSARMTLRAARRSGRGGRSWTARARSAGGTPSAASADRGSVGCPR